MGLQVLFEEEMENNLTRPAFRILIIINSDYWYGTIMQNLDTGISPGKMDLNIPDCLL